MDIDNFKYNDYELNFDYIGKHFCIPEDCVLQIKDILVEIDRAYIIRQNIIDYIDEQCLDSFLGKSKEFWENFEPKENIAICKAINSMNQDNNAYNNNENNMYLDDYVDSYEGKEVMEKINDAINDRKKFCNNNRGM